MSNTEPSSFLGSATMVDSDHAAVREFAQQHARGGSERERAVALYYAVRDQFRYDPYRIDLTPHGMRASTVLATGYGWCVTKAALLAAACRASGIPARLGFADVRNHLSTQRMRDTMATDVFTWHGYADLWLDGQWVKATPAFNLALCEKFGLRPLEFDGREDSVYHAFDESGQRHMEYLLDRGRFDDVPLDEIVADFRVRYPRWLQEAETYSKLGASDFLADVASETGRA